MLNIERELKDLSEYLKIKPLYWDQDRNEFVWLDTRLIPFEEVYRRTRDYTRVAKAIKDMEIRGAPAIGVAAAFGMALAALYSNTSHQEDLLAYLEEARRRLASTRPTAFNLFWALDRIMARVEAERDRGYDKIVNGVLEEAFKIYIEDIKNNVMIGKHGSSLIEDGDVILTHCNTGALATAGFGTALGIVRYAWYEGKNIRVITTETRPVLQGARLNAWELKKEGIPFKLIVDSAVGIVFRQGLADKAIVGADRIILTGHVANKIGTYTVALSAWHNAKPFYVAAPTSTIHPINDPASIVIEERSQDEVKKVLGKHLITLDDVEAYNPAFDVTPPDLISGIVTEKGIAEKPYEKTLQAMVKY